MNGVEGVLAEALCRADDTMFHHDRTDDFPCLWCKVYAAEQVKALAIWAQQDETVEAGVSLFVNEGLIPEDMSYAEVVGTVLTAIFGSDA